MAALDLLSEVAAESPLLIIVEDGHWLDGPSADVLAFVARRIESDSIVLLAATRDGYRSALGNGELPEHRLSALDRQSAAELLDWAAGGLAEVERNRVLLEASGNPLALIELPGVAGRVQDSPIPGLAPLSERLERAFAARIADLPERTRLLLLVAALNDSDQLSEVLAAGSFVAGAALDLESLQPAVEASVIALDERTVQFRHPLVRSAVRQEASAPQRRRVHEALANTLCSDPDRRVWHRAALISGAHEEVAMELEDAGRRARRRGATGVAFTALRRAAEPSEPAPRIPRLLAAAELAFELGEPGAVALLLQEVARLEPGRLERARATWIEEVVHPRPLADGARATAWIAEAGRAGEAGDRELQLDLLWPVAQRAWWSDPGPKAREVLIEAADELGDLASSDPRVLAIQAYADPFGHAAAALSRLQAATPDPGPKTDDARHLGPAATVIGAFDVALTLLHSAIEGMRFEGRLGDLPRLLALRGMVAARLADWDVAITSADESRRLADELEEPMWAAGAETVRSMIAGMRGDEELAERASAQAERTGLARRANFLLALGAIRQGSGSPWGLSTR